MNNFHVFEKITCIYFMRRMFRRQTFFGYFLKKEKSFVGVIQVRTFPGRQGNRGVTSRQTGIRHHQLNEQLRDITTQGIRKFSLG